MAGNWKDERANEKADKITFISVFKICAITLGYTEIIQHELDTVNINSYTNLLLDNLFRARGKCNNLLKHLQTSIAGISRWEWVIKPKKKYVCESEDSNFWRRNKYALKHLKDHKPIPGCSPCKWRYHICLV